MSPTRVNLRHARPADCRSFFGDRDSGCNRNHHVDVHAATGLWTLLYVQEH